MMLKPDIPRFSRPAIWGMLRLCMLIILLAALSPQIPFGLVNIARYNDDKTWSWTAYINASTDQIGKINCVIYTLHPTFSQPVQQVCETTNPLYPFGITLTGWGTFDLQARLKLKDGSSVELSHYLDFSIDKMSAEDNVDRRGGDLAHIQTPDLPSCQAACLQNTKCLAYTFVPAYTQPLSFRPPAPPPICFLKRHVMPAIPYSGVVSGVKQ
jgi:hypothetical protein